MWLFLIHIFVASIQNAQMPSPCLADDVRFFSLPPLSHDARSSFIKTKTQIGINNKRKAKKPKTIDEETRANSTKVQISSTQMKRMNEIIPRRQPTPM